MEEKLFKALDEVVAWFKKEAKAVDTEVHSALALLHAKHGPAPEVESDGK